MDKNEQLQRLLRLKRHEKPPEGFADEFLESFQRRQRTDIIGRSALSIVRERFLAWSEGLRRPAVLWTAGLAYAGIMLTLWMLPRHSPNSDVTMYVGQQTVNTHPRPAVPAANGRTQAVSTAQGNTPVNVPGKRRTAPQSQEKENIIGTEKKTEDYQAPPLREL